MYYYSINLLNGLTTAKSQLYEVLKKKHVNIEDVKGKRQGREK
jgi:hypothetical protein